MGPMAWPTSTTAHKSMVEVKPCRFQGAELYMRIEVTEIGPCRCFHMGLLSDAPL